AAREKAQNGSAIDPLSLLGALGEVMPADTIYVDETITHSPLIRQHLPQTAPQSFFRGSGGLGQGIGTALGLKLAAPTRPVALLLGDGSFLYNPIIQALGASKRHELPIIIVVLNNRKYEAMRKGHVHHYPDGASASKDLHFGVTIDGPDYERLGSHFGFHGERVEYRAELEIALKSALAATKEGRTAILNVMVSREYQRPFASITRIADCAVHLAPRGDFALEVVARLGDALDHDVEADDLELLLRFRLLHNGIDFCIELGNDGVGCLRRREETDPRARIDVGKSHLAISRNVRHRGVAGRTRKPNAADK